MDDPQPSSPPLDGRRFRDYNRMGESLRYSPLPLRKECFEAIKECSFPRVSRIRHDLGEEMLRGRMVARASSRGNSSSNSVY